jgi:hypothetical protein
VIRRATEDIEEEKSPGMDLSLPMTITELIAIRGRILESWADCNEAIARVDEAFAAITDKDFAFIHESHGQRFEKRQDPIDIEAMTADLDYSLYVFALGKLNITNAMTQTAKDEFLKKLREKATPFTEKELRGLAQNAGELFRQSSLNTVREVYKKLIAIHYKGGNWGGDKKDNLRKVEKVFRVGYSDLRVSDYGGTIESNSWRYHGFSGFRFNDLLTACRLIEGKGFTDYSNNLDSLCRAVPKGQKWVDAEYFHAQAYLNGNVKVNWNEEKIHVLEKLNAIGSGRSNDLPDTMRKRYKAEHFHGGGVPDAEDYFKVTADMEPSDEKDFAFYPTPPEVVQRMADLAEYDTAPADLPYDTLEPSAGDGAILNLIPWDFGCRAVEFNHHRAKKLKAAFPAWIVEEADFLHWEVPHLFDRVLMNPPYNDRIEAVHVVKAWGHLKPGGILVAVLPEGWFTREDLKSTIFRAFLQKHEHKPAKTLEAGTFSRTRIVTRIVTLRKAEA